jgi:hypothetical protein
MNGLVKSRFIFARRLSFEPQFYQIHFYLTPILFYVVVVFFEGGLLATLGSGF